MKSSSPSRSLACYRWNGRRRNFWGAQNKDGARAVYRRREIARSTLSLAADGWRGVYQFHVSGSGGLGIQQRGSRLSISSVI